MIRFEPPSAECLVFTYKEGLLSAMAHDLKIRVGTFVIEVDEVTRKVEARFDARSLRVVAAMNDGAESPKALTSDNKHQIEANIVRDVLNAEAYPEIRFTSVTVEDKDGVFRITGKLALHGRSRQVPVRVRSEAGRYIAEARVHQPDFGIRPYSALMGTLKVKPDVTIRVSVPNPHS